MENSPQLPPPSPSPQPVNQPATSLSSQPHDSLLPIQAPPPIPTQKLPKIPKWLMITVDVVVALLLLLTGWWFYNRFLNNQNSTQEPEANRPFTYTPTKQDVQNNWTNYASQKCQYQISYPDNWYIYTQAEQEDLNTILIASSPVQAEAATSNEARVQIGCSNIDQNLSPQTVVNNLNARYREKNTTLSSIKATTISGKTTYYQTVSPHQSVSFDEYYIFPTSNQVVIVNITPANSIHQNTAETILRTFQFLAL